MKGNLLSTIYGAKKPIKLLSRVNYSCFLASTNDGQLITHDLSNLKKNVPSLEK